MVVDRQPVEGSTGLMKSNPSSKLPADQPAPTNAPRTGEKISIQDERGMNHHTMNSHEDKRQQEVSDLGPLNVPVTKKFSELEP